MKRCLSIFGCVLLAGCAGAKPQLPPKASVAPPAAWRENQDSADDVPMDWWRTFGDSALTAVVESALDNNVDIALAASRVSEARAQFRLARAQGLPNIDFAAEGGRDRDINPGFGVPELQTAGEGELQASYDLDLFGRLRDTSKAARAALLASVAARDNVRLAVASSAAAGYITLRALDARLVVLRETLTARSDELRIARRRAQTGYSSQLDLTQAEAAYDETEQLIPATELAIAHQEDGLSLLLGNNPGTIQRGSEFDALAVPQVPPLVPALVLRRRPDIEAAEQDLAAADHALDAARAAFMPDIQLGASGGYAGSNIIPPTGPVAIWALGGSILAPIFESGRLEAGQDAATARRDLAAFAYRKTALTAFREVEDALAAIKRESEQERSLSNECDVLAHTLVLAKNRYRSGYSPYLDQLDAQRGLLSARVAEIQAHADRLNATVGLFQALGGGWRLSGPVDDRNAVADTKSEARKN